jgi:hypothetical protein
MVAETVQLKKLPAWMKPEGVKVWASPGVSGQRVCPESSSVGAVPRR